MAVLMAVGNGDLEVGDVQGFLNPENTAGITPLAPDSLILMDVFYKGVQFQEDKYARIRFSQTLSEECQNHLRMAATTAEMKRVLIGD